MSDQPKAQYVLECRSGKTDAFEPLVHRYQNAAYVIARTYMLNHTDAQDVVQDAFMAHETVRWRGFGDKEKLVV